MIYYFPLESYPERYTYQLTQWTTDRFKKRGVPYYVVNGEQLPGAEHIRIGPALDPHGRSYYGLTQMTKFVRLVNDIGIRSGDVVYMQDMYQPGYECLPYMFSQMKVYPLIATHCLAQSIDPNDFTFPMREWMRQYEMMVDRSCGIIFIASACMRDMLQTAMFHSSIIQVGLPFDQDQVRGMVGEIKPWHQRSQRLIFSSRFDKEKQPMFFLSVAEWFKRRHPDWDIWILTGQPQLRSSDQRALEIARAMQARGQIDIKEGLSKADYYEIVADSRIHFNCALQDFVSNTLNESSALGTPSLLPAYLSFPEAVNNESRQLYCPWSIKDAMDKLEAMIQSPPLDVVGFPAQRAHETLDRVIDVLVHPL